MIPFETIEEDALQKLTDARVLLATTVRSIEATSEKLEEQEHYVIKLEFINGSIKNLLELFNKCKSTIQLEIESYEKKKTKVVEDSMKRLDELHDMKLRMSEIKVDPSLNSSGKSLFDFINEESVEELTNSVMMYIEKISKRPGNSFANSVKMRFFNEWNYLIPEWETIQSGYKKQMNSKLGQTQIHMLLDNNNSLESESVELLKGLNDHWDKCLMYNKSPSMELIQVLRDDYESLPNVIQILEKNSTIISQNCKDISRYLSTFNTIKNQFITFLKEIQDFNIEVLTKQVEADLLLELREFDYIASILHGYNEEIISYQTDFTLFMNSYYNLLVELKRRRKYTEQLQTVVKDFEAKIKIISDTDSNERRAFLDENADFIPQDLISGTIINSMAPNVNVHYQLERIPSISEKVINDVKSKLTFL